LRRKSLDLQPISVKSDRLLTFGQLLKRLLPVLVILGALTEQARGEVTIEVPGGSAALEENLRARLRLNAQACDAPSWRVRRLFGRAEQEFQPALRAFGYYSATVDKRLETGDDCWEATFDIVLGTRTTIRERRIVIQGEASEDPQLQGLLKTLPLAEGAPLNHADYEAIKERLRQFATQYVYLDFEFSRQELRVYPSEAVADIVLEADSGVRYRFGELRFGELPVDEELVRRLAKIREGEPYNAAALLAMNRHLSDSGYFHRVEVRARRAEAEDDRVPIDILLEPAKRHAWRAGIGFATDTGPRFTLRYDNRYLNLRGHRFEAALSVSPVLSGLNLDYVIPGEDPLRESFSFGAQLKHEDTDSTLSDSVTLAARQAIKSERWTQTRFLELLHEKSTVADEDTTSTLLMPGIALDRIKADDLLRTRRGHRVRMEVRGAYDGLVSTATLLQLKTHAKGIYRFGESGRLSLRADAGWTLTDSTVDLPATLRFFAGGDNSVRGYRYQSLGPRDGDGDVKGGKHLLTGSVEYEHPVFGEDWWVAAFVDAGNAFDTNDVDVRYGYGLGVRWYSPVGRVRLDVAIPDDTEDDSWRLHFGLGADL
jgi:translocation and assembly module TamA